MSFSITEDSNITRDTLAEQTVMRYLDKAPLLHLSQVRDDSEFEGIAYCMKSYINPDLYDSTKWSGVFYLVDGEGVKFTAAFYGMDFKLESHCGPVYVKGIKRYKANNNGREFTEFRLSELTQSTIDCPKSLFLKELPEYNQVLQTFRSNVQNLIPTPQYQLFLEELKKYKILETIEQESFADTYGSYIGARMEAFNKGCTILYTMAKPNLQLELCYLGLLLKLWQPDIAIESITVDAKLSDSLLTVEQIYKANLSKLDKIKLVDCVQEGKKSIEGHLVNNVYKLIADTYYDIDQLKFKSTGKLGLFI